VAAIVLLGSCLEAVVKPDILEQWTAPDFDGITYEIARGMIFRKHMFSFACVSPSWVEVHVIRPAMSTPLWVWLLALTGLNEKGDLFVDYRAHLAAVEAPVFALWGSRDSLFKPQECDVQFSTLLRDYRSIVLSEHGHSIIWEAPVEVARAIIDFLIPRHKTPCGWWFRHLRVTYVVGLLALMVIGSVLRCLHKKWLQKDTRTLL